MAIGLVLLWRHGQATAVLYLVGHLATLICWPHRDPRFLVPVLPMIIGCLLMVGRRVWRGPVQGVERWGTACARCLRAAMVAMYVICVVTNGWEVVWTARRIRMGRLYPAAGERFLQAIAWVHQHTDPSSIIMTFRPSVVYLLAGRRAVLPYGVLGPAGVARPVASEFAGYLVLDEFDPFMTMVREGLTSGAIRAKPVVRFGQTWVAEVVP